MEGADSGDLAPDDQLQFDSALDSRPGRPGYPADLTCILDKWHTRYGSLFWDGAELVWETDTRFIDTESLTLADGPGTDSQAVRAGLSAGGERLL